MRCRLAREDNANGARGKRGHGSVPVSGELMRLLWSALLHEAIRPEVRVDVYVPQASDRVLFGALCAVSGCPGRGAHHVKRDHHLCISHTKQWRKDALPDVEQWVRTVRGR